MWHRVAPAMGSIREADEGEKEKDKAQISMPTPASVTLQKGACVDVGGGGVVRWCGSGAVRGAVTAGGAASGASRTHYSSGLATHPLEYAEA